MIDKEKLDKKHKEVPPDYYEKGIEENSFQRFWHTKRFKEILKLVPKDEEIKRFLDVGCDGGLLMNKVAGKLGEVEAWGIDISKEGIAYARDKYPRFNFHVVDCHDLPFKDDYFDLVTCFEVLEHVSKPKKALREMKRCLRLNGDLIILVPSENLLFKTIWYFWTKLGRGRAWHETHINQLEPGEIESILQNMGFEIIKVRESHLGMLKAVRARLKDKSL